MRHRDDPSLSSPVPTFGRAPDVASDLRVMPAVNRSPHRHAPVTAFEWAMWLAPMFQSVECQTVVPLPLVRSFWF